MTGHRDTSNLTAALVARAKEGDQEAYDRLFASAAERAMLFIRLRLGGQLRRDVESMDVLQEAYLDAYQAFDRFEYRNDDAFAKWLCRVIENKIRGLADHFGAQKRQPPGKPVDISRIVEKARSVTGPATAVGRIENQEKLASALERLEGEEREALLLRFFQGRTIHEIADLMGRSPTGIRRLVGRATARLGGLLKGAKS